MTDYAKLVGIFNAFDKMTGAVVEDARHFSDSAQEVGADIGAFLGNLLGGQDNNSREMGTWLGAGLGLLGGAVVGAANKSIKYSSAKSEIIQKVNKQRDKWYDIVANAITSATTERDAIVEHELPLLKELCLKNDTAQNPEYYKDVILNYVIQLFQLGYVAEKGVKMLDYFDTFEEKLNANFEEFSEWSKGMVYHSKLSSYEGAYIQVYNLLVSELPGEKEPYILALFSQTTADYPVLLTENDSDAQRLITAAAQAYTDTIMRKSRKKVRLEHTPSYYKGDGFKAVFNAIDSYTETYKISDSFLKLCSFSFFWFPFVGTVMAFVASMVFDFNPPGLIVFSALEAIGLAIIIIRLLFIARKAGTVFLDNLSSEQVKECLWNAEEAVAEEKFKYRVNEELLHMKNLLENDVDDTKEIQQLMDSHDTAMSADDLATVEEELKSMDYDF